MELMVRINLKRKNNLTFLNRYLLLRYRGNG
jgi:hypothetical protein